MARKINAYPAKIALTALAISLGLGATAAPVMAMTPDMSGLTPTLDYPDPAPQPVTRDAGGAQD